MHSGGMGFFMSDGLRQAELKITLMKLIAEQNHEKYMEYDRATDEMIISEIIDGEFQVLEVIPDFVVKADMVLDRIYEADKSIYRNEIRQCLAQQMDSKIDVRYIIPGVGPRWFRVFLMSVADESGYVTKFVGRMVNIQQQKTAQESMKNQAERDMLSGVYNHATYERLCTDLAERVD